MVDKRRRRRRRRRRTRRRRRREEEEEEGFIDFLSVFSRENRKMLFGQNVQITSQRCVCV